LEFCRRLEHCLAVDERGGLRLASRYKWAVAQPERRSTASKYGRAYCGLRAHPATPIVDYRNVPRGTIV